MLLSTVLRAYRERWPAAYDQAVAERFLEFVESEPDCLYRHCVPGHLTAAALVTDAAFERVLLTHHRKLGIWIQLGGHADGEPLLHVAALKEAEEESGMRRLRFFQSGSLLTAADGTPLPFDLDVHEIPPHKSDPAHLHYDARYLLQADADEAVVISEESLDVRWFTLAEARALTTETSMHRQFAKLEKIRPR